MLLYSQDTIVRVYRVGLGFNPTDDKTVEGDGCTPEGEFVVCSKNPKSKYLLSVGLSYPNQEDAERGLRGNLISDQEYDIIANALSQNRCPPWDTQLGGEIFIHGGGSSSDWTRGCIALDDADIQELYQEVERGFPVIIKP